MLLANNTDIFNLRTRIPILIFFCSINARLHLLIYNKITRSKCFMILWGDIRQFGMPNLKVMFFYSVIRHVSLYISFHIYSWSNFSIISCPYFDAVYVLKVAAILRKTRLCKNNKEKWNKQIKQPYPELFGTSA